MCIGPNGRLINANQGTNLTMVNCRMGINYKSKITAETANPGW
jgi:hypothetical protein